MIEEKIRKELQNKLKIPIYFEVPKVIPVKMIVIDMLGTSMKNQLRTSSVAIQTYEESKYKTSVLNEKVIEAMLNLEALNDFVSVKLNSSYPFSDEENKRYRYQAVFDIKHY